MSTYVVKVPLPDNVKEALMTMTESGHVTQLVPWEGEVEVTLELAPGEDEYDLAERVHEMESSLNSLGSYAGILHIDRPERVKEES